MEKRDPYTILGVSRSASDDEIKSAYRKLARRFHPDMNNNSQAYEARFKEVAEAYEILGDNEKRRRFDRFGYQGIDPNFRTFDSDPRFTRGKYSPGGFNFDFNRYQGAPDQGVFEEIFSEFFNTGNRRRRSSTMMKGQDLHYDLAITFLQAYSGVSANVQILDRRISVHIPPGVDSGSVVRVPGQGTPGLRGGSPGDLFLNISVNEHEFFRREGSNIYFSVPITVREAVLGAKIEIPSPENGRLVLKIPPGTQSGTNFRFRGKGFPSLKSEPRGDYYVTTQIVVPTRLDPASKDLLEQFDLRNPLNPRRDL